MQYVKLNFLTLKRYSWRIVALFQGWPYAHVGFVTNPVYYKCFDYSAYPHGVGWRGWEKNLIHDWMMVTLKLPYKKDLKNYYQMFDGQPYDWWGAITSILPIKIQSKHKWYCSEFVAHCINEVYGLNLKTDVTPRGFFRDLELHGLIKEIKRIV